MITCPYCKKKFSSSDAKMRSIPQNKYYFGVAIHLISEHTGYTTEEAHWWMRYLFLKNIFHIKTPDGKIQEITVIKSTTELTTVEFMEYLKKIRNFAFDELQCNIPEPQL